MYYYKEKYELLISQSPLFTLNKETETNAYKRESLKMVEYLYCYLLAENESKYAEFGMEIMDTANRCIKNYSPESGIFLHYFNAAWKQAYGHAIGQTLVENSYSGIKFTEEEKRTLRKYIHYAKSMGMDCSSSEFDSRVAEAMDISLETAQELRKLVESKTVSDRAINDESEEFSLFDQIDSGSYADSRLYDSESVKTLFQNIQELFESLQERQKPLISKMLTAKISFLAAESNDVLDCLRRTTYFDEDIYDTCIGQGIPVSARDIASQFNVNETSASRSWKNFKEKMNSHLKER